MNRRFFLSEALTTTALLAASFSPLKAIPQNPAPYGASRLEDTDHKEFSDSILQQIREAGLPKPILFDLFPDVEQSAKSTPEEGVIIGVGPKLGLEKLEAELTRNFKHESPCDSLIIKKKNGAARVFMALHETAHYIQYQVTQSGKTLDDSVYRAINKIPHGQDTGKYLVSLYRQRDNEGLSDKVLHYGKHKDNEDRITASDYPSRADVRDRVADASAALYILSNYGNTSENRDFLKSIMDFREGRRYDPDHDTSSSIQAAMDYFAAHNRKGISIVETTRLAAEIVAHQPEFNKSFAERAADIHDQQSRMGEYFRKPSASEPSSAAPRQESGIVQSMVNARNRACGIVPK